jgi:PKD repeat protein
VAAGDAPTSLFVFSPTTPLVSQSVFFNGTLSTPGQGHRIVRYDWDFGTGARRSGSTVTRSYDVAGTYNVILTVTDEVGQTGQSSQLVTVTAGAVTGGTASFTMSPTNPRVGTTVNFNGSGSTAAAGATIVSYAWDFGDGATGTGVRPQHVYASAFTYTIRLTVTDSEGRTATKTETLTVAP